jgi:hypothetical protein
VTGLTRPRPEEHADYYGRYIALVPDGEIVETLRDQLGETLALMQGAGPEQETYRYADGKWSLREVVGHLMDTERMLAFRALAMARARGVELPGMDQDEWASASNAGDRALADLCQEWAALRRSNVHMFASMAPEDGDRTGRASGFDFTVRSFPWIIAGHELWHRRLIERDYLGGDGSDDRA